MIEARFEAHGSLMADIVTDAEMTARRLFGDLTGVTYDYDLSPEVYDATGVHLWAANVVATKAGS